MPRKVLNTAEISGRFWGFASQQRSVNVHNSSVRSRWSGRGGRTPPFMANSPSRLDMKNGSRGLKTYVGVKRK